MLFDMAGNAFLTLIINGTTTGPIIRSLGLCTISIVRERVFVNFLESLKLKAEKKIIAMKTNNYLRMVNWNSVKELVGLTEYEVKIK